MKKTIAIIGAGVSGITAASILSDTNDVVTFESKPGIGGLVRCDRVDGFLYHRVGGHVFNSKNKEVLDWFWSKFNKQTEFIQAPRNAKIFYQSQYIGYPIENYLYQFDAGIVGQVIGELITINEEGTKAPMSYANFEEFLKGNFGTTLYDIYFKPYNQKIWKTDLSTVSMEWLEGKLPMPRLKDILVSNISRQEEKEMVHSNFYYPKNGGSQFIVDRLANGLNIQCSKPLETIHTHNGYCEAFGRNFDALVFTGDVRKLSGILKTADGTHHLFEEKIKSLRSNGTSSVLCECDPNDLSWLYIPEAEYKAHRIIYTGNFSANNNAPMVGRSSCTVEFSGVCSPEEMLAELKRLPGNLKAIAFNHEPNSYVIQNSETRKIIKEYKEYLSTFGIYLLGRFGEWEYYNMDKAMEAAFELKNKINGEAGK